MKHIAALLAVLFVIAATPADIAEEVATTGYHVDRNASATNECVSDSVTDARKAGGTMYIVVLAEEPPGGATSFSENTLTELGVPGTVFTVSPESVGFGANDSFWSQSVLEESVETSLGAMSDNDIVRTFVNTLTDDDAVCSTTDIAGKSSWGFIAFVAIVVCGFAILVVRSVLAGRRPKASDRPEAHEPIGG